VPAQAGVRQPDFFRDPRRSLYARNCQLTVEGVTKQKSGAALVPARMRALLLLFATPEGVLFSGFFC
jgi:hypothetical protein